MLTKSRIAQLLFMLTVLLGLFFWRTFDLDQDSSPQVEIKPQQSNIIRCDFIEPCEFINEQGSFLLSIKNLPIQAEEWIDFELSSPVEGLTVSSAKMIGKEMFMGRIPVKFKKSAPKLFTAKGITGACTTDEMIWELQLTVSDGDSSELLSFDFIVNK